VNIFAQPVEMQQFHQELLLMGVDSGIKVADYTGELISNTGGEVAKQAVKRSYGKCS
jgi:hypothetical protein